MQESHDVVDVVRLDAVEQRIETAGAVAVVTTATPAAAIVDLADELLQRRAIAEVAKRGPLAGPAQGRGAEGPLCAGLLRRGFDPRHAGGGVVGVDPGAVEGISEELREAARAPGVADGADPEVVE